MFDEFLSLILTTFLLLGSPGPAPIALAATGAAFGFRKGIPFLLGILVGIACAIVGASLGLGLLFSTFPGVKLAFQIFGALYILYIAYKIAFVTSNGSNQDSNAPKFRDGFILNLLNPKVYAVFLAIYSQYLLPFENAQVAYFSTGLVCFLVAVVVDILWLFFGKSLRVIFSNPKRERVIRIVFAILMIVAVVYSFLQ